MSWSERIRLKHLQVLIRLCEEKSMSDVARQSNMTQPALSKWLKDFEDNIGMPYLSAMLVALSLCLLPWRWFPRRRGC